MPDYVEEQEYLESATLFQTISGMRYYSSDIHLTCGCHVEFS